MTRAQQQFQRRAPEWLVRACRDQSNCLGRTTAGSAAQSSSWLSSQKGGDLVRLQVQKLIGRERSAFHSSGSNPVPSCEPSQNG
jgi:hypothetical protein